MPIEIFNISFENTQNKQQYGTKITCTEVITKGYDFKKCYNFSGFHVYSPILIDVMGFSCIVSHFN